MASSFLGGEFCEAISHGCSVVRCAGSMQGVGRGSSTALHVVVWVPWQPRSQVFPGGDGLGTRLIVWIWECMDEDEELDVSVSDYHEE